MHGEASTGVLISRLAGFSLRHQRLVVLVWLVAIGAGVAGALRLSPLLSSGFALPGSDSRRVDQILAARYGQRGNSLFVLAARGDSARTRAVDAAIEAAPTLPGGKLVEIERLPSGAAAVFVQTRLSGASAEAAIGPLRRLVGPGVLVTGDAALQHDLNPLLARALKIGELYVAMPVALALLLFVFGTGAVLVPFLFAAAAIAPALGLAWVAAHFLQLSNYLTNMVMMIGFGIAIDYSLLVVHRYRDERREGAGHEAAINETMRHAGRTIVFSGLAVSLGLALMLLLPVPFLRGFGLGGLLVPLISIACALTFLPVLLLRIGDRLERLRFLPHAFAERRHLQELRWWTAHTGWVIRRAKIVAPLIAVMLVAAALPVAGIRLGPGSPTGLPPGLQAIKGLAILQHGRSVDALDPTTIVVDSGAAHRDRAAVPAVARLDGLLRHDPEVVSIGPALADPSGRYLKITVVDRLRTKLIPQARFPAPIRVLAGGGAAYAADFVSRTLGSFPWLILGVLGLTYVLLTRAFRSLLLPLKAILLNLLTVSAACGLMIVTFQWGWGSWAGLTRVGQIEGWIPVFMFTLLFGLSMDYEVFLVSRMREAWEQTRSNARAVVEGLATTGRIVTAAGLIMAAAFGGMLLGSIPTMQQLGFGLTVAILIDITLVRGLLLPSTMALVGRWNWYLPAWTSRALRLAPAGGASVTSTP